MDKGQPQEVDLDRTDKLPILAGTTVDDDVVDDAVPLDYSATSPSIKAEFTRPLAGVSAADRARSGERVSQSLEHEALNRGYENARKSEAAATARAQALASELAELRAALEAARTHDSELAQLRSVLDAEKIRLRDTLAARDATIVQVLHSLGERDAQLNALQREHAQIVPALEERSKTGTQLDAELRAVRARAEAMATELQISQQSVAALSAELKRGEADLGAAQRELGLMQTQASAHLELLRTREWRQGFDQNLFRELEAEVGSAQQGRAALLSEREQLRRRVADLDATVAARDASIADLQAAATAVDEVRAKHERDLEDLDGSRAKLTTQIAALESERTQLRGEVERIKVSLAASETARAESSSQVQDLQTDLQTKEDELSVLVAHLREARRSGHPVDAEVKRLSEELAAKTLAVETLTEQNRSLRSAAERTRAALEEREFLMRRLERSDSLSASTPGRVPTVNERSGAASNVSPIGHPNPIIPHLISPPGTAHVSVSAEFSGEFVRMDGQHTASYPLARRTRIGRAPGCELQIESSSVSRHHALVLLGQRDVIIEDLNSTNGVLVNGRKITRQLLNDGDTVTIGEAQFKVRLSLPRSSESPVPNP